MKKLLSSLVVFALVVSFSATGISEEAKLPVLPGIGTEQLPVLRGGEITITEGWNLIAMPVLPVEPYTVSRFIKEVGQNLEFPLEFPADLIDRCDIDNNGVVDNHDVHIFKEAYEIYVNRGDINADGITNQYDLELLKLVIERIEQGEPVDEEILRRADINGDGQVDRNDYELLQAALERVRDLNRDGLVDGKDLDLLYQVVRYLEYPRPEWRVLTVAVYKDGQFKKLPPAGYSYNMVPGEAYFVYAEYLGPRPVGGIDFKWHPRKTVTVKGRALSNISYHLNRGWNGMSLPKEPPIVDGNVTCERLYTVSDLSKKLVEQGVKATRLATWSAENQNWEQYTLPYKPVPRPDGLIEIKILNENEGFFLLCDENNIFFRDGLEEVQDPPNPPFPPFPPKYIEYTGTVNRAEEGYPYEYVMLVPAGHMLPAYSEIPLVYKDEKIHELLRKAEDVRISTIRGEPTKIEVNGYPMDAVVVREVEFPLMIIR